MNRVWQRLALMSQFQQTVSHLQNPICGGSKAIGDYKQEVESFVDTTARPPGGSFAFGTALMEPILTDGGENLLTYLLMDATQRSPYDILYKDFVATIIMTNNCGYETLRKWLLQQHMVPNGQAYPTSSNELVEMINSGNFGPDLFKSKSKQNNRKKNKDEKEEETVGAIVEPTGPIPDTPTTDDPNPTKDDSPAMDKSDPVNEDVPDTNSDSYSASS